MKKIMTPRERCIYEYLVEGFTIKEISEILGISDKTVRNHVSNVIQKLGVSDKAGAIIELLKLKELSL